MEKECSKCGNIKSFLSFSKDKKGKHGLRAECKECEKKRHVNYLPKKREISKQRWISASNTGDIQYWNIRADRMNSRAKIKFQRTEKVTGMELMTLFLESKRCYYCETKFDNHKDCHIDHVIPLSQNGDNSIKNMVTSCEICNSVIKKGMAPKEMFEYISRVYHNLQKVIK